MYIFKSFHSRVSNVTNCCSIKFIVESKFCIGQKLSSILGVKTVGISVCIYSGCYGYLFQEFATGSTICNVGIKTFYCREEAFFGHQSSSYNFSVFYIHSVKNSEAFVIMCCIFHGKEIKRKYFGNF